MNERLHCLSVLLVQIFLQNRGPASTLVDTRVSMRSLSNRWHGVQDIVKCILDSDIMLSYCKLYQVASVVRNDRLTNLEGLLHYQLEQHWWTVPSQQLKLPEIP